MWYTLSLLSALSQVFRNAIMKDLGHRLDEYINVWGRFTFLLPFALALSLYIGIPHLQEGFWLATFLAGFFITASTIFLSKAFKNSEISIVITLWKTQVLILLVLGVIFLNEHPSAWGIAGVIIVLAGVYVLNIEKARISPLEPIKRLYVEPGMKYALLAALLLAPSNMLFKKTVLLSDAYFSTFTNFAFASLLMLPFVMTKSRKYFKYIPKHIIKFSGMGLLAAFTTVTSMIAYTLTIAAYVEAVKQAEILFGLLVGMLLFKEHERVKQIWPGCLVIIGGIIIIIFS